MSRQIVYILDKVGSGGPSLVLKDDELKTIGDVIRPQKAGSEFTITIELWGASKLGRLEGDEEWLGW